MNELEIIRHPQIPGLHIFFDAMEYRTPHFHSEWELTCPLENQLLLCVDSNFTGKILLRDFAKEEGISMNYLSGFIRKTMNQSFQEYVSTVRFNYACERMVSTDDKLLSICMDSGFSDYRYFSSAVKKRTGHTPEEYREILRAGGHFDRPARQSKHTREQFFSRRDSILLCDRYLEVYR